MCNFWYGSLKGRVGGMSFQSFSLSSSWNLELQQVLGPWVNLYFQNLSFSASSLCCKWAGKSVWFCNPDFWFVIHSQRSRGRSLSTEEHSGYDNCMQVGVRGYNFAYTGAERMGMKADVNTNSKTWHGTGSGAEVCLSFPQDREPTV